MESVIARSENPFTKPLIVIVMMAIVLLGAMTLAYAVTRHCQVVHEVVKTCGLGTGFVNTNAATAKSRAVVLQVVSTLSFP